MSFYSTLYNIHIANNFLLSIISYTYGYLRSNSLINGKFLNQFTLQGGNHMTAISKPVNKQKKTYARPCWRSSTIYIHQC